MLLNILLHYTAEYFTKLVECTNMTACKMGLQNIVEVEVTSVSMSWYQARL
jgi:hypothetical protein